MMDMYDYLVKGEMKLITRKSEREIKQMKKAGDILVKLHKEIAKMIKPGVTTMEIDTFVEEFLAEHDATPEQKGFSGDRKSTRLNSSHVAISYAVFCLKKK